MRVLLIAYACEPNKGSEPGVGWNWAIHLANYINLTVVTRKNNKHLIEAELPKNKNLKFIYFDIPYFDKIKKYIPFGTNLYYLFWELFVLNKIKKAIKLEKIDIIQRVTFVTTVTTLRIYKFNKSYILSFCGGGEFTPKSIYKNYSYKYRVSEKIRILYNSLYKYSKTVKKIYSNARIILAVTDDTKQFLENIGVKNCIEVVPAIGLKISNNEPSKKIFNKIVYAGTLIYLKNVDIIIKAIERCKVKVSLDVFGEGNCKFNLQKYVLKNNLLDKVIFKGNVSRDSLLKKFREYDLAIHASSHDSGSMFILEAISNGIPVLFLDTGGPKEIFKGINYPLKVDPNLSYDEIINNFAKKIEWFYENYNTFLYEFKHYRDAIIEKYEWDNKAKRMIKLYRKILNENSSGS